MDGLRYWGYGEVGRGVDEMSRKNVYLGTRVRDIPPKGLSHPREAKQIADAIVQDYRMKKISYKTAMSRMNLLELVVQRNRRFKPSQKERIRWYIDKKRERLKKLRHGKKKRRRRKSRVRYTGRSRKVRNHLKKMIRRRRRR